MNTQSVSLVPIEKEHLPFLERLWKDPETSKHTGIPARGIDINQWYAGHLKAKRRGGCAQYIILLNNDPIGETAYGTLPSSFLFGTWEKDPSRKAAMADIKVDASFWGKGIGSKAFGLLLDDIFENTDIMDVVAIPMKDNDRAKRMFVRCGMHPTGDENPHGIQVYIISREGHVHG